MTKVYARGKQTNNARWGRWKLWATFALAIDAERFAEVVRRDNPTWRVMVGHTPKPSQSDWSVERSDDGQLEVVRPRTSKQEREHERRMETWARRDNDFS